MRREDIYIDIFLLIFPSRQFIFVFLTTSVRPRRKWWVSAYNIKLVLSFIVLHILFQFFESRSESCPVIRVRPLPKMYRARSSHGRNHRFGGMPLSISRRPGKSKRLTSQCTKLSLGPSRTFTRTPESLSQTKTLCAIL